MSFLETVERARAFLERNGRVSLSALRLEFGLGEPQIDALAEELVEIQRVAVRDGRALAWAGGVPPTPTEPDRMVFNAESKKGVFRYFDEASSGGSFTGVPGESARGFGEGDWLIRAVGARRK